MDDRQALSVVAVGVGAELVLNLVGLHVGHAAHLEDAVFRHGRIPHQVAARLHVVDILEQAAHVDHRVARDCQRHIVRDVVLIGAAKVGLHRVAQGVKRAGQHLHAGNRSGVSRVQNRKARCKGQQAGLHLFFLVGDDRAAVHLRAGAGSGDHRADRKGCGWELVVDKLHLPQVLFGFGLRRHNLAAVDDAAAAHRQDVVDPVFLGQLGALLHLVVGWVWHDAGKVNDLLAGLLQQPLDLVIDAACLDRAAAVGQHHRLGLFGKLLRQHLWCNAFPKINLGRIGKSKGVHNRFLLTKQRL